MPRIERQGQVVVELAVTALVMQVAIGALLAASFIVLARAWIRVEAFAHARASLYGETPPCRGSAAFPAAPWVERRFRCVTIGVATGTLARSAHALYETRADLVRR